jgi:hypothetical protein
MIFSRRTVIYPWLLRNGVDVHHYPSLNFGIAKYHNGNDPFMPTEFLHGLYDGGHGAGLEDYWAQYQSSPLHAGGFLWVFSDEAVLRTDMEGRVYDSDRDHAPDGILGPYREKGGSYNTIREIWSPVQVKPMTVNRQWNGRLFLEDVDDALNHADVFSFTAIDHHGNEVYTWTWPVIQTWEKAADWLAMETHDGEGNMQITENETSVIVTAGEVEISFDKANGALLQVRNDGGLVSFTGGRIVGGEMPVKETRWGLNNDGDFVFVADTDHEARKISWTVKPSGLLMLETDLLNNAWGHYDFLGISFDYPEDYVKGVKWLGQGPYRVWKNRLKGTTFGVWEKAYNNTVTGESFNELIYPEFKGYHAGLYWMVLETTETPITILSETPNLFFKLYTPARPEHVLGGTYPPFPEGDISFLYEIPAIGTKFKKPEYLGIRSQQGWAGGHRGEQTYPIRLWFDFRFGEW